MQSFNQDTTGCFYLMFMFFIVSSVVGGITSVSTSWFGFPPEWGTIITLPLIGAGMYLIYRGYSLLAWGLLGSLGIATIAGLALLRGFTVSEPTPPAELPAWITESVETYSEDDFLYGGYYGGFDYTTNFEIEKDGYVVLYYGEPRTDVYIEFPAIESLDGQWAFEEGTVRASAALRGNYQANTRDNFAVDDVVFEPTESSLLESTTPYMVLALPFNAQHIGETIDLDASLTIQYPIDDQDSETGFKIEQVSLKRTLELFVVDENTEYEYYSYFNQYGNWKRAERVVDNRPGWIPLAILTLGGAIGAAVFVQRGALREYSSGGFGGLSIQVRKLSGLENLGVQAHSLNKVSSASAENGVFLGLVIAQSPAGRAGLQSADILVSFGGKTINSPSQLNRAAGKIKRGEAVQVTVIREELPRDIIVRF